MDHTRSHILSLLGRHHGVLLGRDHPQLARTLRRMAAEGELTAVLPGTFVVADTVPIALRAVCARYPDAVIMGTAAAQVSFWPAAPVHTIEVARPHGTRAAEFHDHGRFSFVHRSVPRALVRHDDGVRRTTPALTALGLRADYGGEVVHQVLRSRTATVAQLHRAFTATPHRRGNTDRMRVLLDTCTAPWSEAEQLAHRVLTAAGITGWVANHPVGIRQGLYLQRYYLDIAFWDCRVAVEIEGNAYHSEPGQLTRDRYRSNDLVLGGWRIIRIDWRMLTQDPEYVVATIRALTGNPTR